MKRLLLTLNVAALATTLLAQGTIAFTTYHSPSGVDAKVYWDWWDTIPLSGNNYLAQLLAAPGQNQPASALVLAPGTTSFRTGIAAGYVNLTTVTLIGVPRDYIPGATVQMVAWDNSSGLYPTWAQAEAAWHAGQIHAGASPLLNIRDPVGGALYTPPFLTGLQSFNLGFGSPEPSTLALTGLGAALILIFRRRQ